MAILVPTSRLLADFDARCVTVGVKPTAVLKAAGIHPTLWPKWREGGVSPTLRNFEAAVAKLEEIERNVAAAQTPVSRNRKASFPEVAA